MSFDNREYVVPNGMPRSVFENKYSRNKADGSFQTYAERITEVIRGNFSLDPRLPDHAKKTFLTDSQIREFRADDIVFDLVFDELERTTELAVKGIFPTAGRHFQHGDMNQADKVLELFANCATAITSFMKFRLMLRGAGVGRDYSTATCRVDWSHMPDVRLVLDESHPDFDSNLFQGFLEPLRDARHKYDSESERVRWFRVDDTREGWAKIIEILETAAWQEKHAGKLFIFDFTQVRPKGAPIVGLQGRAASGPIPLMDAIAKVASIKAAGMKPWKQALFIDHYLAACVHLGGARRAARMATKDWRDRDVLEFIDIKRGGFLWSANNSILVDAEFWTAAAEPRHSHARRVFEAAVNAAYWDRTGEPGFLNVDKLNRNLEGIETITGYTIIDAKAYPDLHPRTKDMLENIVSHVKKLRYHFICNPCQPAFAPVLTPHGISSMGAIEIGDKIWSQDGFVEVVRKWSTGVKSVYRYRTTAGVFYGTEDHRIMENNQKISVKEAEAIDCLVGCPAKARIEWDSQTVMDGLVIGDGSVHMTSACPVYLTIGQDDTDYIESEVGYLIIGGHAVRYGSAYKISTTVQPNELPPIPVRAIPSRFVYADFKTIASFLRGLYSANGSVVTAGNNFRITLKSTSSVLIEQVQIMLSALGIPSFYTTNKPTNIQWDNGIYQSRESYDVNITGRYGILFENLIGFLQRYKMEKLQNAINSSTKAFRKWKSSYDIRNIELIGEMEVYDIEVSGDTHTYWTGGCNVSNCAEIVLSLWGGYCTIGDICLAYAETISEALDAVAMMSQFLIRANLMKCDYAAEVKRTNRIGVSLTGIHEFAWKLFGLTFYDMIDYFDHDGETHRAHDFWMVIKEMRIAAEASAVSYSLANRLQVPHTVTTIKPSGTISKVMDCTEGAHLPAVAYYLRWVQYRADDPAADDLKARGYPIEDIGHRYHRQIAIGFPTRQKLADLMGDKIVTADEATPEEQFKWLMLLERYWLGDDHANQVSYTLKYDTDKVSYPEFMEMILKWQPQVRCCAVMPSSDWRESKKIYGYVPEQPISREEYESYMSKIIAPVEHEAYDDDMLACESGVCPIEPDNL